MSVTRTKCTRWWIIRRQVLIMKCLAEFTVLVSLVCSIPVIKIKTGEGKTRWHVSTDAVVQNRAHRTTILKGFISTLQMESPWMCTCQHPIYLELRQRPWRHSSLYGVWYKYIQNRTNVQVAVFVTSLTDAVQHMWMLRKVATYQGSTFQDFAWKSFSL